MRLPLCALLLWLFFEELQASPVKPSFQSGSKIFDASKPQQVSNYQSQVSHFQPEHRAKTRHKIKVVRYRLDPWSQIWLKSEVESYHVDPDSHIARYPAETQQPAHSIHHQTVPQFQAQQPQEATNQGGLPVVESNRGQLSFQSQTVPYMAEPPNQGQVFSFQAELQNQEELPQPEPHVLVQSPPYQAEPMTHNRDLFYQNEPLTQMVSLIAEPQIQVQGKLNQIKTQVQGLSYEVAPQTKLVSFQADPHSRAQGLSYQAKPQSEFVSFHTEPQIHDQGLAYQADHKMLAQGMSYEEDLQSQMTSCQTEPELQTRGVMYQVEPQSQVASLQMEHNVQSQDLLYEAEHQIQAGHEGSYKVDPPYHAVFHEAEPMTQSHIPSIAPDPQSQTLTYTQPHIVSYQTNPQAQSDALPSYQSEECALFSEVQDFEPPTSA